MLRKILPIMIGLVFLSSCNFPLQKTPDPLQVEQIVALTLTAEQGSNSQQTPEPQIISPSPIMETETPTSTDTPEPTLTNTPTVTVTPLDTPGDGIKNSLGNPTWKDTLDNGKSFGLDAAGYEDENSKVYIENGTMVLSSSSIYGYRGWRLTVKSPDNIYLEARINVQACAGSDTYGLVFRAPDYSSGLGYYLGITCDGQYNLTKWTDSDISTVLASNPSSQINAGAGQTNDIGVHMVGSNFTIYINNTVITEFSDSSFENGGHFGVFISGQSAGAFTVRVEEIAYWTLD